MKQPWLSRLSSHVGTVVCVVILLTVGMPLIPLSYIGWRSEREIDRQWAEKIRAENAAVDAILATSPDAMARLRSRGVSITTAARREVSRVEIDYTLTATDPAEFVYPFTYAPVAMPRLIDPSNGNVLGRGIRSESRDVPGAAGGGELVFENVSALTGGAQVQLPFLMVYLKPEAELKWAFQRPLGSGEVQLGHRFGVSGIEFELESIRFGNNGADVAYHQVTPFTQVGLHLLSFRLSDGDGGIWSQRPLLDPLPDPMQPSQHFNFVTSQGKNWTLEVEHAVLTLPGPTIPVDIR